jgi:hypothetical protein
MAARFEWDPRKAASNARRHGVSFEEALTVFANPLARIFDDEDHPVAIRIINARAATGNEREDYEEGLTT